MIDTWIVKVCIMFIVGQILPSINFSFLIVRCPQPVKVVFYIHIHIELITNKYSFLHRKAFRNYALIRLQFLVGPAYANTYLFLLVRVNEFEAHCSVYSHLFPD